MESNSILLIQETKKTIEDNLSTIKKNCTKGEGKVVSTIGAWVGLLTWWDEDKYSMRSTIENRKWLFVELEDKENKEVLWVGNIYGPTIQAQKESFWNSLEDQCSGKKQCPYIIVGDFSVTISVEERRGGTKVRDPYGERLEDLISYWGLTDIKPKNGKFTWNNKRIGSGHITARLDRVLVSPYLLKNLAIKAILLDCLGS